MSQYHLTNCSQNGEVIRLTVTIIEYECIIEGAKVLALVKAGKILSLKNTSRNLESLY